MGAAVEVIRVNSSPMSVVKTGTVSPPAGCLLRPDALTSSGRLGMSQKCQERKSVYLRLRSSSGGSPQELRANPLLDKLDASRPKSIHVGNARLGTARPARLKADQKLRYGLIEGK
jgi:hypothetical protein